MITASTSNNLEKSIYGCRNFIKRIGRELIMLPRYKNNFAVTVEIDSKQSSANTQEPYFKTAACFFCLEILCIIRVLKSSSDRSVSALAKSLDICSSLLSIIIFCFRTFPKKYSLHRLPIIVATGECPFLYET